MHNFVAKRHAGIPWLKKRYSLGDHKQFVFDSLTQIDTLLAACGMIFQDRWQPDNVQIVQELQRQVKTWRREIERKEP